MIDIIKKYRKHNIIKNAGLVATSLVLAFGINFIVANSSLGQKLQISVLNSGENGKIGDVYLENNNDTINLVTSKDMTGVKSFSLSIIYNPENVSINSINSLVGGNIVNQSSEKGLSTIIVNFQSPIDIKKGDNIINIKPSKITEKLENLNIINTNFSDSNDQVYLLSSSGVEF